MRNLLRVWPWMAAIATGFLCALPLPPFDVTWLCWIALTPLLTAVWFSGHLTKRRWLRDLSLGYVAGLTFVWTVFSWLQTVTVPGWFLLAFYMAIYFALWAWLAGFLRPASVQIPAAGATPLQRVRPTLQPKWAPRAPRPAAPRSPWLSSGHNLLVTLILASAWVAVEWLRGWVFSGWGWNVLGTALHGNLPLIQIVEWTGVAGLSFMVAAANVMIVATIRRFSLEIRYGMTRPHYDFTLTMAAIIGLFAYGVNALRSHREGRPVRIACVQANVPREEKFTPAFTQSIFDRFRKLTETAVAENPPPDLVVWPESSMPGPVLVDEENYRFVFNLVQSTGVDLLLGTIDQDEHGAYNAAVLFSERGRRTQVYRKLHLVPFGEYVPGRNTVPFIARIVGDQVPSDFDAGRHATVFQIGKDHILVAPLICFEDTIGELARQFVLGGASLLVNVTNDGWFLQSAGSRQHLDNAVFRCVELRRPMVRAANTGVTCFIDERGQITRELRGPNGSQFTEGVLSGVVSVPVHPEITFYAQHGELFAKACAWVALLAILGPLTQRLRQR